MKRLDTAFKWFTLGFTCLGLYGCQSIHLPNLLTPKPEVSVPKYLAKVIIYHPRESLLPFFQRHPIEIYKNNQKVSTLKPGEYLELVAPEVQDDLEIHWFQDEQQTVSQVLPLIIDVKTGDTQVIALEFDKRIPGEPERLTAQVKHNTQAAFALNWMLPKEITDKGDRVADLSD